MRILTTNSSMSKGIKIDLLFCTEVTAILVLQTAGSGLLLLGFELDRERHWSTWGSYPPWWLPWSHSGFLRALFWCLPLKKQGLRTVCYGSPIRIATSYGLFNPAYNSRPFWVISSVKYSWISCMIGHFPIKTHPFQHGDLCWHLTNWIPEVVLLLLPTHPIRHNIGHLTTEAELVTYKVLQGALLALKFLWMDRWMDI